MRGDQNRAELLAASADFDRPRGAVEEGENDWVLEMAEDRANLKCPRRTSERPSELKNQPRERARRVEVKFECRFEWRAAVS